MKHERDMATAPPFGASTPIDLAWVDTGLALCYNGFVRGDWWNDPLSWVEMG